MLLRIIIYIIGYIFGYNLMLLPNILSDDVGIYKSISPIVSYGKLLEEENSVLARIIVLLFLISTTTICILFWSYTNYCLDIFYYCYEIMRDWGYDKLEQMHNGSTQVSYVNKGNQYYQQMNKEYHINDI